MTDVYRFLREIVTHHSTFLGNFLAANLQTQKYAKIRLFLPIDVLQHFNKERWPCLILLFVLLCFALKPNKPTISRCRLSNWGSAWGF
jgi:hypothetical protein